MSTKDDILSALLSTEPLSGEQLAQRLSVSRSAVWKAIGQLRGEGYVIEAAPHRGYRLMASPNRLSAPEILKYTGTRVMGRQLEVHDHLDSTNLRAKALAAQGAPHGLLICADSQSQGRGRFGRAFFSPEHSGVYITYLLRPEMSPERAAMITSLAAVAVSEAIESLCGVEVGIKWVNDLYIRRRKVCGILCEAGMDFESGTLNYVALGIGINVGRMTFPEPLRDIATSIENEWDQPISRNRLIGEISNRLEARYPELATGAFMGENRRRSIVIGREVTVLRGNERYSARVMDIDDLGHLVVEAGGEVRRLGAGEISLKLGGKEG